MSATTNQRAVAVWAVLIVLTVGASLVTARFDVASGTLWPRVVLLLCVAKAVLVADTFMGLHQAGWGYRIIGHGWIALVGAYVWHVIGA